MAALADAGVDVFAFETLPNFAEVKALIALLTDKSSHMIAWLSFSINDAEHLCDGTSLVQTAQHAARFPQVSAIGVNCTAMENVNPALRQLRPAADKPLISYPNNGDRYDSHTKTWQPNPQATSLHELVPRWLAAGASIVGGCCRTTPADIREIGGF